MRTVRWLTSGLALVSLLPAVSAAQSSSARHFEDSWFWGAKAGLVSLSTSGGGSKAVPAFGAEWLITRSKGALYLAGEQAFFKTQASIVDESGTPYTANIQNMRRYTAAVLAFPVAWGGMRPYGGAGFSMNLVRSGSGAGAPQAFIDRKSSTSFLLMSGLQAQYRRISLFGQATFMPARNSLFNRSVYIFESGVRYNFSSSRESVR
jgi:opacity protein-like surface antigen